MVLDLSDLALPGVWQDLLFITKSCLDASRLVLVFLHKVRASHQGSVDRIEGEIDEERPVAVLRHEVDRFAGKPVRQMFAVGAIVG